RLRYRDNHRVAELSVRLRVGNRNPKAASFPVEAHQSCTLARRQTTGIPPPATNQNLRAVLEIPRRQRSGHVRGTDKAESEAVSLRAMFLRVCLQVIPEMIAQSVPGRHPGPRPF